MAKMGQSRNMKTRMLLLCGVICICAIVAAKVLATDGGSDASAEKWQYLAFKSEIELDSPTAKAGKTITKLGREGWELVGIENHSEAGTTTKTVYYFKKRL
jgi:hypothetical protein